MNSAARKYERTHPWLTFKLDLQRLPAKTWLLLGEANSKCDHLAGVPLRPATAKELHQVYLAKGALATTAIEGNTLSEDDAMAAVKGELNLPPSRKYLGVEIQNVIDACNAIWASVLAGRKLDVTPEQILSWNEAVLRGLTLPPEVEPGKLRRHLVGVLHYRAPESEDCAELLRRLCVFLADFAGDEESGLVKPILGAIVAHVYLAWIHPFGDGNGRTARLTEFAILVGAGMPMPAAHLLSNHYNATRDEYYRQLSRASASGGDLSPFIAYAVQGLVDQLREQLQRVRAQQLDVAWRNFVHEEFRTKRPGGVPTPRERQRDLVLELSRSPSGATMQEIPLLTPVLARAYAGKTLRGVRADVAELVRRDLVEVADGRVRAKTERILAFLPLRNR